MQRICSYIKPKSIIMKKLLLTFSVACALAVSVLQAQISDFTIDSCYFANTIGVVHYNFANDSVIAGCGNEFGFEVGDNEILTMGTRLVNMGQHDCSFQGLGEFDACHGHIHLPDMANLYIANACGEVLLTGDKLGFNMQDGANFVQWVLSGNNECDRTWLSRYGYIDPALVNTPPNPNYNGSDRMGLSAGFYDTYGPQTWGNGIRINGLPNETYYACFGGHFSQYMNQGLNPFPDSLAVSFTLTGSGSTRIPTNIGAPVVLSLPVPVTNASVITSGQQSPANISWNSSGACRYKITPAYKSGNTWIVVNGLAVTTSGNSFSYPYSALDDYKTILLHKNGAVSFTFDIKAINGTVETPTAVRTSGTVNIK